MADARILSRERRISLWASQSSNAGANLQKMLDHAEAIDELLATVNPARLRQIAGYLSEMASSSIAPGQVHNASTDLFRFAAALESATQPAEATGTGPASR